MRTVSAKLLKQMATKSELDSIGRKTRMRKLCVVQDDCSKAKQVLCAPQTKLRWMASQLLTIQENERKRIATDLHDGLGQSLTMIKFALGEAEKQLATGAIREASESLQRLKLKVHGVLDEVRHVSMDLRPPMLDDLGILATLSWFYREVEAVCPALKVEKDICIHEGRVPVPLKITIFRIIQEATNNVIKHANADLIRMSLREADNAFHLAIEDNGDGFDPASVAIRSGSDRGLGLLSMKERANLSGGAYVMNSIAGQGTQIRISWQLDKLPDSGAYLDYK